MARTNAWRACASSPVMLGLLMRAGRGGFVDLGPARRSRDRAFQPVRLGQLIEPREVGGAQSVLRAEVHEPPDHGVAPDQPGADPVAVFVGPMPDPGLRRRERVADRRVDRPAVAGQ